MPVGMFLPQYPQALGLVAPAHARALALSPPPTGPALRTLERAQQHVATEVEAGVEGAARLAQVAALLGGQLGRVPAQHRLAKRQPAGQEGEQGRQVGQPFNATTWSLAGWFNQQLNEAPTAQEPGRGDARAGPGSCTFEHKAPRGWRQLVGRQLAAGGRAGLV